MKNLGLGDEASTLTLFDQLDDGIFTDNCGLLP